MQFSGAQASAKAAKSQANLEAFGQQQKVQAMELDAHRRTREALRQSFIARSSAINDAANSGTQYGSSLPGIEAGISAQTSFNIAGIQQNLQLGREMAETNKLISGKKMDAADAASLTAEGAGLSTIGGALIKNIDSIDRVGGEIKKVFA